MDNRDPKPSDKIIHQPLNRQTVIDLARALATISENSNKKLVSKERDTETQTAEIFLASTLRAHASEFIGSWLACKDEYEPLMNGVAGLLRRCTGINDHIAAQLKGNE
jgi:hypothetical protein